MDSRVPWGWKAEPEYFDEVFQPEPDQVTAILLLQNVPDKRLNVEILAAEQDVEVMRYGGIASGPDALARGVRGG